MSPTSLAYRALDAHVIGGRADHTVLADEHGTMTYADLLGESAALAGGLRHLGLSAGELIDVSDVSPRVEITALLACARIHAEIGPGGDHRLVGQPATLHTSHTGVGWDVLVRVGRTDPGEAPADDPDGYAERLQVAYPELVSGLLSGSSLT